MKRLLFIIGVIFLFTALATACDGVGSGPQTWFDYPIEEDNPFPIAPITLQAHASDIDGVASIAFSVDDSG
jgi:hypothetical protein